MSIPSVHHDPARRCFEVKIGERTAFLTYVEEGPDVVFDHTYVPDEFRGQGVAAALVQAGLEEARRRHWRIVPRCSYVAAFIARHPEFADLVHRAG